MVPWCRWLGPYTWSLGRSGMRRSAIENSGEVSIVRIVTRWCHRIWETPFAIWSMMAAIVRRPTTAINQHLRCRLDVRSIINTYDTSQMCIHCGSFIECVLNDADGAAEPSVYWAKSWSQSLKLGSRTKSIVNVSPMHALLHPEELSATCFGGCRLRTVLPTIERGQYLYVYKLIKKRIPFILPIISKYINFTSCADFDCIWCSYAMLCYVFQLCYDTCTFWLIFARPCRKAWVNLIKALFYHCCVAKWQSINCFLLFKLRYIVRMWSQWSYRNSTLNTVWEIHMELLVLESNSYECISCGVFIAICGYSLSIGAVSSAF